jgi:3'-phosphoadenosine 5'-phosphosulfate sulfotransferase
MFFFGIWNLNIEFKLFYSSVAGVTVSSAGAAVSVTAEPLFQLLLFGRRSCFFSCILLSEPLSESPSTIAVTKDKILSIDLEASFDGITNSTHEDQS